MTARSEFQYFGTIQIVSLVLLQVAVTVFLWRLNPVTANGTALFAIFLSVDLLSFALISNIYRQEKQQKAQLSMKWLITGYIVIALLVVASFLPGR